MKTGEKTEENNKATVVGYLTHASKSPKDIGGDNHIELSNKSDFEPQYLKTRPHEQVSLILYIKTKIIAADGSIKEAIIDEKIKKHEKYEK